MFASIFGLTCKECGTSYYKKDGYNKKFCSIECKWEWEDRKERKKQKQIEKARQIEKEKQKLAIKNEIDNFKATSKQQIATKYNIEISFNNEKINVNYDNGKIANINNLIKELEKENNEIISLVEELIKDKDAV